MKKTIFSIIVLIIISVSLNAQNNRFFISSGSSFFSEIGRTPVIVNESSFYSNGRNQPSLVYSRFNYLSLYVKSFNFRLNLFEFNNNNAIALNLYPSLGLTFYNVKYKIIDIEDYMRGIGKFDLPLFLSYEIGLGSTYNSSSKVGAFVGFGWEYTKSPIIQFDAAQFGKSSNVNEAVIVFGLRFWSFLSILQEINFKIGIGGITQMPEDYLFDNITLNNNPVMVDSRAFSFRLTWMRNLRY